MPEDTRPPHVRLQASIAKLTKPFPVETKQRPEGGGWKLTKVMHEPLLIQLQVMSGASLGTRKSPFAGSLIIDADAVEKLAAVESHLMASWVMLIPGSKNLVADSHFSLEHSLSLWADIFEEHRLLFLKGETSTVTPARVDAEARVWGGWVKLIESKFSPERTLEFADNCPNCQTRYVLNAEGERVSAVVITDRGTLKDSEARCRFCSEEWIGEARLYQFSVAHKRHLDAEKRRAEIPLEMAM